MRDYRRGVLLGLSLAEVFILLLFCFLLLIAPRLVPQPEGRADKEQPAPLSAENQSGDESFVEKPLTLDSTPLTPGLDNESLSPPPLAENPAHGVAEMKDSSTDRGTNDEVAAPYQAANEAVDLQEAQGSESLPNISNDLSDPPTAIGNESPVEAETETKGEHNWPPIIPLDEAAGYSFPTGSAELSESFAGKLKSEIREKILEHLRDYKADVVEVVGHTDERPINGASNLDNSLIGVFSGQVPAARLSAADNVGLGMARAAAVAQVLQSCIELEDIKVIPYSGGQVIERGDQLATGQNSGDRSERRRIEIRVRRSTEALQ